MLGPFRAKKAGWSFNLLFIYPYLCILCPWTAINGNKRIQHIKQKIPDEYRRKDNESVFRG